MIVTEQQIKDAIYLLSGCGYIVIKETKAMKEACEKCELQNGDGDCFGCSASICVYNM